MQAHLCASAACWGALHLGLVGTITEWYPANHTRRRSLLELRRFDARLRSMRWVVDGAKSGQQGLPV